MPAHLIDGRALAGSLRAEIARAADDLRTGGTVPVLAIFLAGHDESNEAYRRGLERAGQRTGVEVRVVRCGRLSESDAMRQIRDLATAPDVHGILIAHPLPAPLTLRALGEAIPPERDVDGANAHSRGRLAVNDAAHAPATATAALIALEHSPAWPPAGKSAVVVGRSPVVGLPVALMLLARDATVTIAHRQTRDLPAVTRRADILVAASGVPGLITGAMVKAGATVIDVGTAVVTGKIVGDVDFPSVSEVAGALTPVPGGVGPLTNLVLMRNVVAAASAAAHDRGAMRAISSR